MSAVRRMFTGVFGTAGGRMLSLCLAAVCGVSLSAVGQQEDGGWRQEMRTSLERHFPELVARSQAEFGLRSFADDAMAPLAEELPARVVLLLHGLDEPGRLWITLAPVLVRAGRIPVALLYPNDQPVRRSSAALLSGLGTLRDRGVREVIIVAHSMGGIVSREMLTNPRFEYAAWRRKGTVPAVERLIMVGTPNHGSELAQLRFLGEFRDQWVRLIEGRGHILSGLVDGCGEAGADLAPDGPFLRELNARPLPQDVAMTLIAGVASPVTEEQVAGVFARLERAPETLTLAVDEVARSVGDLADGVGDGAVPLASTYLDGVDDHVTVKGNHLSMIRNVLRSSKRVPPALPVILDRINATWAEQ